MQFARVGANSNLEKGLYWSSSGRLRFYITPTPIIVLLISKSACRVVSAPSFTIFSRNFFNSVISMAARSDFLASTCGVLDLSVRKIIPSPPPIHCTPSPSPSYDPATSQYSPVSLSDSESCEVSSNFDMKTSCEVSSNFDMKTPNLKSRTCRPFKAYMKDPLNLAQALANTDMLLNKDSSEAFLEFRNKIMSQVNATHTGTNKNMRRTSENAKNKSDDPTYWEKRRKNNEAAKRSRDARRAKEDEIAIRCAFLERENCHLKYVTESLKAELERLQKVIYYGSYKSS